MSKGGKRENFYLDMVLKGTQESGAGKIAFEKKKNAEDRDSSEKCNFQSCVRQTDLYKKNILFGSDFKRQSKPFPSPPLHIRQTQEGRDTSQIKQMQPCRFPPDRYMV